MQRTKAKKRVKFQPNFSTVIEIESYKKYNLESDENVEENQNDKNENKEINEEKTETKQRCCNIF